jgi:hypothetical protein
MLEPRRQIIDLLESAVFELGLALADVLTLVGGCLTPLLITDPGAPRPRVTIDVDLVVKSVTLREFDQFSEAMRTRGFRQGLVEGDPICRFRKAGLTIDLLPVEAGVLGFGNPWYPLAVATAATLQLPSGRWLRHATAACFLATKIAAFRGRGSGDYLGSHDFEDIVAVMDGRPELIAEVLTAGDELRDWIRIEIAEMIQERAFLDSLPGMIPGVSDLSERIEVVLARFRSLASG